MAKSKKAAANSANGGVADVLGGIAGQVYKSTLRQAVNQISRQIVRGILGSLTGKRYTSRPARSYQGEGVVSSVRAGHARDDHCCKP